MITKYPHLEMLPEQAFKPTGRRMTLEGGSSGGGGSTSTGTTTQYSNTVQPELMPYAQDIASKSQTLSGAQYTPYQGERIAGFNPNQQNTMNQTMGLQTPGQFGTSTNLSTNAGIGSFGAGQNYGQMATDPNSISAYMSPYMQNVVDYQKGQALRDFQIAQPMRQAQAVGQGAFGGSRSAIVDSEAQRALNSQLQGIQATGTQNAFGNAQQAQQFGSQLGLQGLNQANQAAQTLSQTGTAQQNADLTRLQAQAGVGAEQQALQQAQDSQAYQDFLKQQEYPYSQLAFYNSMVRGLSPVMPTTTQTYTSPPSALAQLSGLGLGAYSLGKMTKKGGIIKAKKKPRDGEFRRVAA